ncbi:MAG: putative Ig domain-containing protein, partial [Pseudobdellovibrionaceae bacterium]|nr:putative Ig domain-containing protein [Pseudobdellovibrionaceae bacterium]
MLKRGTFAFWGLWLAFLLYSNALMAQVGLYSSVYMSHALNEDTSVQSKLPVSILLLPGQKLSALVKVIKAPSNGYMLFKDQALGMGVTLDLIYVPNRDFRGTDTFVVESGDSRYPGKVYRIFYTILVNPVNDAPQVWAQSKLYAQPGREMKTEVYVRDPDGDALIVTALNLPLGAKFDAASRVLSWTPTSKDVGIYTIRLSAKDNATETVRDVPLEVVAQRTPRRVWYDGINNGFVEGIGWDTTGSNVKEAISGTNKYIAYTINNQSWWGAAAYSFSSNTQTDLSAYAFLKFDLWSSTNVSAMIYLVDYMTGKESAKQTFALTSVYPEMPISRLFHDGFQASVERL